jgi:signal transduction histidine kinase
MKGFPLAISAILALAPGGMAREVAAGGGGPMVRVARWLSPDFRQINLRLVELDAEMEKLPQLLPQPFASRYGFRSGTLLDPDKPQWLQIDLQRRRAIDRIVAVPVHIPTLGKRGEGYGFPRRFKIEVSDDPGMKNAVTVVDRSSEDVVNPGRYPEDFRIEPVTGRYVRFTATRHFPIEEGFMWALEELLLLSGNQLLGVWCPVETSSQLDLYPNWSHYRVQDGQSSLGLPVTTEASPTRGYLSGLADDPEARKWLQVDLGSEYPVDEIRLLPVESGSFQALGDGTFPRSFTVELATDPEFQEVVWSYTRPKTNLFGYPGDCAVVLQASGERGRYLRFVTLDLWGGPERYGYGLAEIQVFAGDENVALGKPVATSDAAEDIDGWAPEFLVDGFSSRLRLVEYPEFLDSIQQRRTLERERGMLFERSERKVHLTGLVLGYGGGGLGAMAVLGSGLMLMRQRTIRRQAVALLRDQIARDLHDDIGSNLGGIVLVSEIGSKHSADPQSRADFQAIKEAADEASASMRDIVWLIQRGHFGLRDLVTRIRQSARMILGENGVLLEVEPSDFKERSLSLLFRRHVFFAFKETLNNVRKHAGASKVEVRIQIDSWHLSFTVRDDGTGFDPEAAEIPGNGLNNLKRRAARLKGSCRIESQPGRGSVVTFSVPLKS